MTSTGCCSFFNSRDNRKQDDMAPQKRRQKNKNNMKIDTS